MSLKEKLPPGKQTAGAKPIHAAPQWLLEALRSTISFGCRRLWHIQLKGVENIPQNTGLIVAANHQSYGDPFWLSIPIKTPTRYLAWSEAFQWPLVGRAIGLLGAWPLQVEGADPSAIRRSLNWLREGGALVIFPEGGRGLPDGTMIRMKGGAVRMALEAEVPILPVTIRGGNEVWPREKRLPRPGQVEITYHPVMHIEQRPDEDPKRCARRETERLADIIRSAL